MSNTTKKRLYNTYEKGMYMDSHTSVQPDGTYPFAQNIVNRDFNQREFISNEHSDRLVAELPAKKIGKIYQEEFNRTFYLLENESIYYQDNITEEIFFVAEAKEFGCSWTIEDCENVDMEVYVKSCDTYLQWSSNWVFYIINVSQMLNDKRKEAIKEQILSENCKDCNKTCDYFRVFKPKCPVISEATVYQRGGSMNAGAYVYTARLLNSDGNTTNFGVPSNVIYVYSEHNIPGENARGRAEIKFTELDCNYDQIEIAYTYFSGSQVITRAIPAQYFSGTTFTYVHTDSNEGDPIQISETLSLLSVNLEGRYQEQYGSKMYYTGIKPTKEYNVQKIADEIEVDFYTEKYSLDLMKKYQIKTLPRGEVVPFGIWLNHDDGTRTFAGHIPCNYKAPQGLAQMSGSGGAVGSNAQFANDGDNIISVVQTEETERSRSLADRSDSTTNPIGADQLLAIEEALVNSYITDIDDVAETFDTALPKPVADLVADPLGLGQKQPADCCDDGKDEINQFANERAKERNDAILNQDLGTFEEIAVKWGSILSDLIGEEGKKDLVKTFTPSNIKSVAQDIITAVKRRETIKLSKGVYNVLKKVKYSTGGSGGGSGETTQYPGGIPGRIYSPECYEEQDTVYPCTRDCEGNFLFKNHGKKVTHNRVPNESVIDTYESSSIGVPSQLTPEADEYADGYGIVIGARFKNIIIDHEEYELITGKRLCKKNPFTIGQVKLDSSNKSILTKGAVTSNFESSNQGKVMAFQNLGVNSFEKCDKHINIDGSRMDPSARTHNSVCMYSLDQAALEPDISGAQWFTAYKLLSGIGYRHQLFSEGRDPENKLNGRKVDIKGTVQSVNLSQQKDIASTSTISFAKYVDANTTAAPDSGGDMPLMNKYGQANLWIQGPLWTIKDKSFVGDGLVHAAPITDARMPYGVVWREMPNQFGSVENLTYFPVLQGTNSTTVKGLIGDRYISPYSFVKTNFVSDKVGNKFNIGLLNSSKSDRCICDDPDDAVNGLVGKYYWTKMPKSGDVADAKNWSNLHTPPNFPTRTWEEANAQSATESDTYYWGTLTTLITYWGEWETNPWGTEIADELENQRYPFIRAQYNLGSNIPNKSNWEDGYLDQFHIKVKQPSAAEKLAKVLILSFINLALPLLGISDVLSPDNVGEFVGDVFTTMGFAAVWLLLAKVLFTNDFVDELIGLPICKPDDEGGIDFTIDKFFTNWNNFSSVFRRQNDILQVAAFREITNCCDDPNPLNSIYWSDLQIESSRYNGYTHVRANNFVDISLDKGRLTDLYSLNGTLFAHTTEGIYTIVLPQLQIQTNTLPLISGQANQPFPQLIVGSNPEGYAGLVSRTHALNCQAGRFFLDYESGIMYRQTDKIEPISMKGAYNFFKRYTKYCNESKCENGNTDQYFTLGFDPHLHRLLITKFDVNTKDSWTISYDTLQDQWISMHTYLPKDYLVTRDKIYHLSDTEIYVHDNSAGTYGIFMGKEKAKTIIDTKTTTYFNRYGSHVIDSVTEQDGKNNIYRTFDSIGMLTSRQTAGIHPLIHVNNLNKHQYDRNQDNINEIFATQDDNFIRWNINELFDYTLDANEKLINFPSKCNPYYEFINYPDFGHLSEEVATGKVISGDWFLTRLIFNNEDTFKIYLRSLSLITMEEDERR